MLGFAYSGGKMVADPSGFGIDKNGRLLSSWVALQVNEKLRSFFEV